MDWLAVGIGGLLGSLVRYALGGWIQRVAVSLFPWGTLVVNVSGSFLLGVLMRYGLGTTLLRPEWRLALTVGFCGGFTTFSTFSYETLRLLQDDEWARAGAYVALSVGLALVATLAGIGLGDWVLRGRRGV